MKKFEVSDVKVSFMGTSYVKNEDGSAMIESSSEHVLSNVEVGDTISKLTPEMLASVMAFAQTLSLPEIETVYAEKHLVSVPVGEGENTLTGNVTAESFTAQR